VAALLEVAGVDAYGLRLLWLGVTSFTAHWAREAPGDAAWRLSYCDEPGARLLLGDRLIALPARRAVLIPPTAATVKAEGSVPHLLLVFEFRDGAAAHAAEWSREPLVLAADDLRDRLCVRLRRDLEDGQPISSATLARAEALLHLSVASAFELGADALLGDEATDDGQRQLQPVLAYVEAHLDEALDNTRLASLVHASESHFIRLFRRVVGCTPARYVQERRVQRAAELLTGTSLTIDEVAERCGFANRYHFSRVFAQRMVEPPGRFRSRHGSRGIREAGSLP
jgi:AraC-like DNA-binding protein